MKKTRISHHLHDGLGQNLSGISYMLAGLKNMHKDMHPKVIHMITEIDHYISDSLDQTRRLARGLRPKTLSEKGLMTAIKSLKQTIANQFCVNCTLEIEEEFINMLSAQETHELYFIILESVTNAIKHGKAKLVTIHACYTNQQLSLEIEDNGVGFDWSMAQESSGIGTKIIQYRARTISWELKVISKIKKGTTIACWKKE